MTEVLQAILNYAFNEIELNRIQADVFDGNIASERVLTKCGMQFEGIERQKYNSPTGFKDCENYAILREDYINKNG